MSDDVAAVPEAIQEQPHEAISTAPPAPGPGGEPPAENPPAPGPLAPGGGADPAPKRKAAGRPHGAKDRVPRTRRPAVSVRVEPLSQASGSNVDHGMRPPAPPVQSRVPTPMPVEEPPPPPPPSPRTMLRETARHMTTLRNMVDSARRAKVHEEFSSKLLTWPIVS